MQLNYRAASQIAPPFYTAASIKVYGAKVKLTSNRAAVSYSGKTKILWHKKLAAAIYSDKSKLATILYSSQLYLADVLYSGESRIIAASQI